MLEPLNERLAVLAGKADQPSKFLLQILPEVTVLAIKQYPSGSNAGLALAGEKKLYRSTQSEYRVRACTSDPGSMVYLRQLENLFLIREGALWFRAPSYRCNAVEGDLFVADWFFLSVLHLPPRKVMLRATDTPLAADVGTEAHFNRCIDADLGPDAFFEMEDQMIMQRQMMQQAMAKQSGQVGIFLGADCVKEGYKPMPVPGKPALKKITSPGVYFNVTDQGPIIPPELITAYKVGDLAKGIKGIDAVAGTGGVPEFWDSISPEIANILWDGPKKQNPPDARMSGILDAVEQEKELPHRQSRLDALLDTLEAEEDE